MTLLRAIPAVCRANPAIVPHDAAETGPPWIRETASQPVILIDPPQRCGVTREVQDRRMAWTGEGEGAVELPCPRIVSPGGHHYIVLAHLRRRNLSKCSRLH